jgi:outer membrane receptor protein involved in Fe transport
MAETASADTGSEPEAPASSPIVVTAQHREQSAQDVGIALSVVGQDMLRERGITNVNQLQDAVPALQVEPAFGGGAPQFRLRGVGFQDYASNNSPTVGVYVNEVAYPVPIMTQGLIFDVARVEALRGPQGTLYGRNTTGGAINFVTNRPTDTLMRRHPRIWPVRRL